MLQGVLREMIGRGLTPSLSCMVLKRGHPIYRQTLPDTGSDPMYDLASLTKPLLTWPLLAHTGLSLARTLDTILPGAPPITLHQLATHTSGLKPWLPLYLFDDPYETTIFRLGPGSSRPAYSCLNYILLSRAIESAETATFAELVESFLAGIEGCDFSPGPRPDVMPTEQGNSYELAQARSFVADPDPAKFRLDTLIHGEVHDLNAWYDGGISGNAGLFANLTGCAELARRFLAVPNWQLPLMQADGYRYHLGFTGTGLAVNHNGDTVVIFLSNRVHPRVEQVDFSAVRHQVFTEAFREYA